MTTYNFCRTGRLKYNMGVVFAVAMVLSCLMLMVEVGGQCTRQVQILANDIDASRDFGYSLGVDGSNAIVGAPSDTSNSGAVYLFTETSPGIWMEVQKLTSSNGVADDEFGYVTVIHGINVFIGAPGANAQAGAVYLFTETTPGVLWSEVQILQASDTATDLDFGAAIAVDGATAFVGAYDPTCIGNNYCTIDSGSGPEIGFVYVFVEVSPGNWVESQILADHSDTYSGFGLALVIDGGIALVGEPFYMQSANGVAGNVRAYEEISPGNWSYLGGPEMPYDGSDDIDRFGFSVAISGTNWMVGAPYDDEHVDRVGAVYVFNSLFYIDGISSLYDVMKIIPSSWASFQPQQFGHSIAAEGSNLVVGAFEDDGNKGAVYVYTEISPYVWTEVLKLLSDISAAQSYGRSIALSVNTMLIGKNEAAYFFFLDDVDDCSGHLCEHGATCVDAAFGYCCDCPVSHDGDLCQDCACENGGVCEDDPYTGIGYCDCRDLRFVGGVCDKSCHNGYSDSTSLQCNCTLSGATGKFCTNDVDDCLSSPCANGGGTCTDHGADLFPNHNNEFNCSCDGTGFVGSLCDVLPCSITNPCVNNGTCVNSIDFDGIAMSVCNCTDTGFEGDSCHTEIDECASLPCLNDGVCLDFVGTFHCDCTGTGYEGVHCADDIDDCFSSPCQNGGICQDKGINNFQCTCNSLWEGDTCSDDVDDCLLTVKECLNGGVCSDDPVNMGDVRCDCSAANTFTGKYCDVPIEDACVTYDPCFHGGKCILDDITKTVSCDCANTGYEGDICDVQVYVSECISSPCLNEGQCYDPSDYQDDWYCVCANGYSGDECDFRACDSMPCENDGTCTNDDAGGYTCTCAENYSGAHCEVSDGDEAQLSSSSSSSTKQNDGDVEENDEVLSRKEDGGASIIIIVVVVVVVAAGAGFVFYKKTRSSSGKEFVMPT